MLSKVYTQFMAFISHTCAHTLCIRQQISITVTYSYLVWEIIIRDLKKNVMFVYIIYHSTKRNINNQVSQRKISHIKTNLPTGRQTFRKCNLSHLHALSTEFYSLKRNARGDTR